MAETDFKYDVFVSYSSANKDWVRKTFVPILEKASLRVCDYYRDFDVGAPIVMEMERAILESRKTIPILSPAYLQSGWTEFESLMFQTLDAANRNRRVLPVMLEKCDLPLRIKYMNCINFANPDDIEIEWQRLSRALEVTVSPALLDAPKPDTGSRETWHLAHPYPMPPNFTGRAAEQKILDNWLADDQDRLFILRALGGFGKSALAWQWISTQVNPADWTKVFWWSFYEGDASFEHFIEETLKYLKLDVPQGQRPQVDELLNAMQGQKILLIMDGFERTLRAYSSMNAAYQGDEEPKIEDNQLDCVNINAEIFLKSVCSLPNIKSKVLMTTRLTPRAVKPRGEFMLGCREVELTSMQPADAVEFFHKQKIKGTHAEIAVACASYGYHPLSLRLLAGRILKDFENPADIVVAQKLKIDGDIIRQKHHILEISYNSLPPHERKLLSTIACFRSPVEHNTLVVISKPVKEEEKPKGIFGLFKKKISSGYTGNIETDLNDLVDRGLLHFDEKNKKFDLHPIVRRYAYDRLTTPDRTSAHVVLVVYFEAVPPPPKVKTLEDLAPVIELYHHMVRAGNLDEALKLFYDRFQETLYFQFGAYQLQIELLSALFLDGEDKPPRLKRDDYQAWTLIMLANSYAMSGQPRRAVPLYEGYISISEKRNEKTNIAIVLGNVAQIIQLVTGELSAAERNLRRRIDLGREAADKIVEATGYQELGRILSYRSAWQEAEQEVDSAIAIQQKIKHVQTEGVSNAYHALRFLLMARANPQSKIQNLKSSIECSQRALELAGEQAKDYSVPRDYVRAYWLLGAAYCANNELTLAEENLSKALNLCRQINDVAEEADILLDLARLRFAQSDFNDAQKKASEALTITERCGYVLQGADVNLFLAQYALEQEKDKAKAKQHAEEAKKLATCDGPPYYYKVAHEEAERMLEKLK